MILLMMIHLSQVGQGLNNIIGQGMPCKLIKTWMISLQEFWSDLGLTGWDPPSRMRILLAPMVAFEPCLELKNSRSGILDVGYVNHPKKGRKISIILLGGPWGRGCLFPSRESEWTSNLISLYLWFSPRRNLCGRQFGWQCDLPPQSDTWIIQKRSGVVCQLIDPSDWVKLLTMQDPIFEVKAGQWIQVRKEVYKGDLGL